MINKLSINDEKDLELFIKEWIRVHGYSQKDLANELNISSSRTSAILTKLKELHKKGGMFNIARKLIEIEQKWLNNDDLPKNQAEKVPYDQLDINYQIDLDNLLHQMDRDHKE